MSKILLIILFIKQIYQSNNNADKKEDKEYNIFYAEIEKYNPTIINFQIEVDGIINNEIKNIKNFKIKIIILNENQNFLKLEESLNSYNIISYIIEKLEIIEENIKSKENSSYNELISRIKIFKSNYLHLILQLSFESISQLEILLQDRIFLISHGFEYNYENKINDNLTKNFENSLLNLKSIITDKENEYFNSYKEYLINRISNYFYQISQNLKNDEKLNKVLLTLSSEIKYIEIKKQYILDFQYFLKYFIDNFNKLFNINYNQDKLIKILSYLFKIIIIFSICF